MSAYNQLPTNVMDLVFILPVLLCIASAITSALLKRGLAARALISALTSVASATMVGVAVARLAFGIEIRLSLSVRPAYGNSPIPWPLSSVSFAVDGLSAFFTLMLGLVSLAASIYSFSYLEGIEKEYGLRSFGPNYSLFIALMYLVLTTQDLFWFIVFWELMTLASQFLVSVEHRRGAAVRAGLKYFTLTKVLAEFMIAGGIAVMILGLPKPVTSFQGVALSLHALALSRPAVAVTAVSLMLAGLAVKVSLIPLHSWLPDAHPEAPSNVSALLSGVMVKIGIYMMFRLLLYFLRPSLGFGAAVACVGAATLVYGTFMALKQVDSKRLLAYHSVGQLGYVALGLGACVTLLSTSPPHPVLAAVAGFASLYHALNHSAFKSLLFLTAGSVERVTGLRNLNLLGGLGRAMPLTAASALIGSLAISGVPPLNGFVSKWLLYASTLTAGGFLTACGFAALFISAVTTASFIKYYTTLFGRPSRVRLSGVREVPAPMLAGQAILAGACVALGLAPTLAWRAAAPALTSLGLPTSALSPAPLLGLRVPGVALNSPLLIAALMLPTAAAAAALLKGRLAGGVWGCGATPPPERMAPPASSYYEFFEHEFPWVYRVGEALHHAFVEAPSKALPKLLKGLQNRFETPSPMAGALGYVLAALALGLTIAFAAGVIRP